MKRHDQRCRECKVRIEELLIQIYGEVKPNYNLKIPAKPEDYLGSVWNKGRSDKNGKVKNYKTPDWTVFYNGMEKELKPLNHNLDNQADIQIGIINLY